MQTVNASIRLHGAAKRKRDKPGGASSTLSVAAIIAIKSLVDWNDRSKKSSCGRRNQCIKYDTEQGGFPRLFTSLPHWDSSPSVVVSLCCWTPLEYRGSSLCGLFRTTWCTMSPDSPRLRRPAECLELMITPGKRAGRRATNPADWTTRNTMIPP